MPTPRLKLTKAVVEAAPPHSIIRDKLIGGFYLKSGERAKTFVFQRDVREGDKRRTIHHTIGRYTGDERGVTCEAARQEAIRLLAEPARLERQGMTFAEAVELYKASPAKGRSGQPRAPETVRRYAQMVKAGYLEDWMERPLHSLTRTEVGDRHRALTDEVANGRYAGEKSSRSRPERQSGKTTADDVFRWFRAVWNRAMRADETLPVCPTINVNWWNVKAERSAIPSTKLAAWHEGVLAIANPVRRDYLLFVLFTGMRRRAAAEVRWADVDFARKVLHVPRPKGGAEHAFDLPLSDYLLKLLKERQRENPQLAAQQVIPDGADEWVFPAYSATGHISEPRAEIDGVPFKIHDLRRTFITVAESLDLSPYVIGALVNHRQPVGSTTAGYVALEVDRLRGPMQKITDQLRKLVA